ncbi:MAG: acyl-ACP--UDP-N-acetylglucosamine O-acyltransferase [Planctomycetes bacterium]|nr:acyl-ACP--UDP-N-acetylglucosamine O-acyltransferase [Planctomycetota bacterium]
MPNIHHTAVVHPDAEIADTVEIGPHSVIGPNVKIGEGTHISNGVSIYGYTTIGEGNRIFPGSVIGTEPQDLRYKGEPTKLDIGNHNIIREHVTINTGTEHGSRVTKVGSYGLFMAGSHIAHDCEVADNVILANAVLLAGHVKVERNVTISGNTGIHHFVTIGEYCFIGGMSRISTDSPPYMLVEGNPATVVMPNVVGLQRAGFTNAEMKALKRAHRLLYRSDLRKVEAYEEIHALGPVPPCVEYLVNFLKIQSQGINGRFREVLRHPPESVEEVPEELAPPDHESFRYKLLSSEESSQ